MISCKEAVARLWTYLDRNLGGPQEQELEEHLGLCRHCCGELEFAKELQAFLASQESDEIPPHVKEHLERFVEDL